MTSESGFKSKQLQEKWQELGDLGAETEKARGERQQRKIIAALLYGNNGEPNLGVISMRDVAINDEDRRKAIEGLVSRRFGSVQERQILRTIKPPIMIEGADAMFAKLNTKHELRILGIMTDGVRGFSNYDGLDAAAVERFVDNYPTPMDFEEQAKSFVETIAKNNNAEKARQYELAMQSFMSKIYGKRQEYWEQMKKLNKEASEVRTAREVGRDDTAMEISTPERHEWVKGDAGVRQISREQARNGYDNNESVGGDCEDSYLVMSKYQLYGVFDGTGGHVGGAKASRAARDAIKGYCSAYAFGAKVEVAESLNVASRYISRDPEASYSTAVLAKVHNEGPVKTLEWASVGDSRIYVIHADGNVEQVTTDEGEGSRIFNALGLSERPDGSVVRQKGELLVREGDRFMMCSDGITGDREDEQIPDDEIAEIVLGSWTPQEAADRLLKRAKKVDDQTVLVFEA